LLHVAIDQAANVWPLVPPNRNNAEMLDPQIDGAAVASQPTSPTEDAHALPA
jgi:acetolactate synthase-1/2/3 large subunit